MGARRIGEYRESKTEATRFRRAFFLVSRALRSLERPESCARPPARGCPLPFTTPRSVSGSTSVAPSRARNPSLFLSHLTLPRTAHPCVRPCLVIPRYAMLRHTTPHRNCVFTSLSRLSRSRSLACYRKRVFSCTSFHLGVPSVSFLRLPFQRFFYLDLSFRYTIGFLELSSNYPLFCLFVFLELSLYFSSISRLLSIENVYYKICLIYDLTIYYY